MIPRSRIGTRLVALAALMLIPTLASAGVIGRVAPAGAHYMGVSPGGIKYGLIQFTPRRILLRVSALRGGRGKFSVDQRNNPNNRFVGGITCVINLGQHIIVRMHHEAGLILVTGGLPVGLNVDCTVTVLGLGGVTGTMPVIVTVGL